MIRLILYIMTRKSCHYSLSVVVITITIAITITICIRSRFVHSKWPPPHPPHLAPGAARCAQQCALSLRRRRTSGKGTQVPYRVRSSSQRSGGGRTTRWSCWRPSRTSRRSSRRGTTKSKGGTTKSSASTRSSTGSGPTSTLCIR